MKRIGIYLLMVGLLLGSCKKEEIILLGETGSFTDERDGTVYQTITLGGQTWMAENLHYNLPDTSSCFYFQHDTAYQAYGYLYTWEAAKVACPPDWHLPSDEEWKTLEIFLEMEAADSDSTGWRSTGSVGMKIKYPNGWNDGGGGNNQAQMNVLPGGFRETDGTFHFEGDLANIWTSTSNENSKAWGRAIIYYSASIYRWPYQRKTGFSVRCVLN